MSNRLIQSFLKLRESLGFTHILSDVKQLEPISKEIVNKGLVDETLRLTRIVAVSYTHLTLPTTPYV